MSRDTEDFLFITGEMASHQFIPGEESRIQVEGKYRLLKGTDDWNFDEMYERKWGLHLQWSSWEILKLHINLLVPPRAPSL